MRLRMSSSAQRTVIPMRILDISRVIAVTLDNMVGGAGGITTQTKIDYEEVARGVVAHIGFDSYIVDRSSVNSKGLSDKTCEVLVRINKQSPTDGAGAVHGGWRGRKNSYCRSGHFNYAEAEKMVWSSAGGSDYDQ